MIKKYIKPETIVCTINLSKSLLLTVSGSDEVNPGDFDPNPGGTGEPELGDGEYSRSENNRSNVWDNIW